MEDKAFDISVDISGEGKQELYVVPDQEEDKWVIVVDGVTLGTLYNDGETWSWLDSGLGEETAEKIGLAIESHYL